MYVPSKFSISLADVWRRIVGVLKDTTVEVSLAATERTDGGANLSQQTSVDGALDKLQHDIPAGSSTTAPCGTAIGNDLTPDRGAQGVRNDTIWGVGHYTYGSSAERWPSTVPSARVISARPCVVPADAAACLAAIGGEVKYERLASEQKKQKKMNGPMMGGGCPLDRG